MASSCVAGVSARQGGLLRLATRWGWLVVVALAAPAVGQQDPADGLAPVPGRFEVFRTDQGFAVVGFRASVGSGDRFVLTAGMPAASARAQMLSIDWDWTYGLTDPEAREFWGRRAIYLDIVENVAVVLDPTGRWVQSVAYSRQPARYSRFGLEYYLHAAFREGRTLVDTQDRVLMEYGPRDGQRLRVEATRIAGEQTRWRLVFRIDGAAAGVRTEGGQ